MNGAWRSSSQSPRSFSFSKPLLILHSDGWGRVGVRDNEGYELLRTAGIQLGRNPYDFYTLETAEDVIALHDLLKRHHDSAGRSPCMSMNFVVSNVDFAKTAENDFRKIELRALAKGLPGSWKRPGLFEAYRQGITSGVFHPALHGLTHFCSPAVEHHLAEAGERRELLRTFWRAETPYIYWRMPWVGYEYFNPEKPHAGFLSSEMQEDAIRLAAEAFAKCFKLFPTSACAPGFRTNQATYEGWAKWGVRVAQDGSGAPRFPHFDESGILNLHRTIELDPVQRELPIEKYVQLADECFACGMPAILSVDSINFHSSLRNFRGPTLWMLDLLLSALEQKYPDLLYVHDLDLYKIVTQGRFKSNSGPISVLVKQRDSN